MGMVRSVLPERAGMAKQTSESGFASPIVNSPTACISTGGDDYSEWQRERSRYAESIDHPSHGSRPELKRTRYRSIDVDSSGPINDVDFVWICCHVHASPTLT